MITFDLRVLGLDGRAGALTFSGPITPTNVTLATCSSTTRCDFAGVSNPDQVAVSGTANGPLTVTLLDEAGNAVDSATLT